VTTSTTRSTAALSIVLAGGGTAGHVEPALALADALVAADPATSVVVMGTAQGLETRLVPARGHRLATIPRVPLPRRPTLDLLRLPWRLRAAIREAGAVLDREQASALVGFGGYVSLPAYLAARRRKIPFVVHEANARAGLANRIGARLTPYVAVAHPGTGLRGAVRTGIPLRAAITGLDRAAARPAARAAYGLDADGPVLLVSGGSQGARRINDAVVGAAADLDAAGIQVLHHAGLANVEAVASAVAAYPRHHVVPYIEAMDQAYAAADLMLCRAGAMTCAELSAVGLPAVYVPLPIGNGEQRLNALPVVDAGGGILVEDAALDAARVRVEIVPLLGDRQRLAALAQGARGAAPPAAAGALIELIRAAVAAHGRGAGPSATMAA
jgi:UDP-N-acetylglucosamine--N-acetylmuramyl-(pentapeptide) pyrophosphoryl-undecaprenol N-acetylglucosamine transferase